MSGPRAIWVEWAVYTATLAVLAGVLLNQGRANAQLQRQAPLSARAFYSELAHSQVKLQIVDARESAEAFEDTHVPGAIPVPGCDLANAPQAVRDRVYPYVPTVVITDAGDGRAFGACSTQFALARNLQGGMEAWSAAGLPEDSGEWVPPKPRTGGGCL